MKVIVFDRRKLKSPIVAAAALLTFAVWRSEWLALVGLPLVYLSWCGCAPNLNLADGCLPMVSAVVALAIGVGVSEPGLLAAAGVGAATWVAASLESAWVAGPRSRPPDTPPPPVR